MSIAWTDVQSIAPEQTDTAVPVGTQTVLLQIVDLQIDDTAWDDLANIGRMFLAAHLGALYMSGTTAPGAILGETLGPMSRVYGLPQGIKGALGTTKYGLEYLRLIELLPGSIGFVP